MTAPYFKFAYIFKIQLGWSVIETLILCVCVCERIKCLSKLTNYSFNIYCILGVPTFLEILFIIVGVLLTKVTVVFTCAAAAQPPSERLNDEDRVNEFNSDKICGKSPTILQHSRMSIVLDWWLITIVSIIVSMLAGNWITIKITNYII